MDIFWEELTSGLPDVRQLVHVLIRMIAASVLGAVVGHATRESRKTRRGAHAYAGESGHGGDRPRLLRSRHVI